MDQVQTLISQFLANVNIDDSKSKEIAQNLANLIESQQIKLLDLVKALGDYLTADDDLLRPKATMCLSQTLGELPSSVLSKHDIQVLIGFYISKLDDIKSTKESLIGLNILIQMKEFAPSNIKSILTTLKDQYQQNQHLASTRFFTFEILNNLFILYQSSINSIFSKIFIKTFIHIASGEKDPKNLLKSFSLNSKISLNLEISNFKDDLFDVLFCYFPISFKPPKDDPYKITSDQLKTCLRTAIASSHEYSQDAYPNLLEKLTSTSPTVKLDTIETIHQCIINYGFENLEHHYVELWNALKFEILHGDPEDDEDNLFPPILKIFTSIASILQSSDFVDLVLSELSPNIKNSTNKQKQSCIILAAIATSNPTNFDKITHPTLTLLLNSPSLSIPQQRQLITNLSHFINSYSTLFTPESPPSTSNALLSFKDELLIQLGKSLMSTSLIEISLRTLTISELTKLTTLTDFLTPQELSLLVQYFTETILIDDNEYVYGAGIAGLITVCGIDTSVLLEVTYPLLVSLLPSKNVETVDINGQEKKRIKVFEVIRAITRDQESVKFVIEHLVTKFGQVKSDEQYEAEVVETLLIVLREVERLKPFNTDSLLILVDQLEELSQGVNDSVLDTLGDFIKLIVVYSSPVKHQDLVGEHLERIDVLSKENRLINVLGKIIAGVDKKIKFPQIDEYFVKLINFTESRENWDDLFNKIGYLQLISILINKFTTNVDQYLNYLNNDVITPAKLEIFTWISKAVILKSDPESSKFIDVLVSYLSNETYGSLVTKSFEILVIDLSIFEKFKKINNNNVRLLYKQKFFQIISPILVSNFKSTTNLKTKSNYLTALSYILKHTKREIIIPHLTSFFPLLLQALSLPNPEVRYASVNTILSTIDEIPELISSHLSSLIPSLLKLVQKKDKLNKTDVRYVSLNCLEALTHCIKLEKLIPFQDRVLKELSPVLDDGKRRVRKAAVDARQAYFELGRTVD